MNPFTGYQCSICGKTFDHDDRIYTCPYDGGNLDVILDYGGIRNATDESAICESTDYSLWRYLPLLPVHDPHCEGTSMGMAGWTPVYSPAELKKTLGLRSLWIKDEGRNPTASFKDRASSIVVARARDINAEVIVTASTGNAGAALAGMSAAMGQKAVIFAPGTAPQAKIAQLLVYGAKVILVSGNYDTAFDLAIQAANEFGWYCRNTGYNPFTAEGKKTGAFEIWEQIIRLQRFEKPLNVFVSVGDGNIISGLHKGFIDLHKLGWLENIPRLFGVQSEKSSAVANAFSAGTETILPVRATTIADSISVDLPRDGVRAVRAARETKGRYITVTDEQIIAAIAELGRVGIFSEPAGSAAYAGLKKAISSGCISGEDPVVVINTGNGLKDIRAAMLAVENAPIIEPSMSALKKHMRIGK